MATLAALWLAVGSLFAAAPVAEAASADVFDTFDVVATLDSEGYVHVTETIVLRFGPSSGRHGLERTFIVRAPDGDTDHDVIYPVDQVAVTSTSGVSTELSLSDQGSGRSRQLRVRVGSADEIVSRATATYVLSYRIGGLVRTSGSYDELYWNVSGSQMPLILEASAKITVPGGAKEVFCSVARPPGRGDCTQSAVSEDEVAKFAASNVVPGNVMTVGVKIDPGLITQNTPILVENGEAEDLRRGALTVGGSLAAATLVPFAGWLYARRRTRDLRWEGLPPGVFPSAQAAPREVLSSRGVEIPVCFAPPKLGVAEAGFLVDGNTEVRDTTAALMSLAVAGAVELRSDDEQQVRLVDASRAPDDVSGVLLSELFPLQVPGETVDLGERGVLSTAHHNLRSAVQTAAREGRWYTRMPDDLGGFGALLLGIPLGIVAFIVSFFVESFVPFLVAAVITIAVWVPSRRLARGQRSAKGRALTDQVEGFRKYLATAEAQQLRFEEGEDIFSRYLPWAIMFDLAERWAQVCQQLVELGRLSGEAPSWTYDSNWTLGTFAEHMSAFDSSVENSVASVSSSSSYSEGGSSSSSSFEGGSSGGGGGGGGGGSW